MTRDKRNFVHCGITQDGVKIKWRLCKDFVRKLVITVARITYPTIDEDKCPVKLRTEIKNCFVNMCVIAYLKIQEIFKIFGPIMD